MHSPNLEPAATLGGRPRASIHAPDRRSTAFPFPVPAIPIALTIFLAFVAVWSWTIIRPRINAMLHGLNIPTSHLDEREPDPSLYTDDSNVTGTSLSSIYSPQVRYWSSEILIWASEFHIDPNVVALVMQIESCGHPRARSQAGAMGLFQVMPFHFGSDENPYDPTTNARRGLAYLSKALDLADGRLDLALAGYNGGHQMIHEDPSRWSDETRRYVDWGTRIFNETGLDGSDSPSLRAWLNAGGEQLCRQASNAQAKQSGSTTAQISY